MTANTTDARTETTRHATEFDTTDLIEGDRIAPELVARHEDQLGQPITRTTPDQPDNPDTQLVTITELRGLDDVHRAILFDPETGVYVRASRHDSQSAWSQKEADWKVHDVGDEITVTDGRVKESSEMYEDHDGDETEWVAGWAEVVLTEPFDVADERRIDSGNTLRLRDPYEGGVAYADVEFGWDDE